MHVPMVAARFTTVPTCQQAVGTAHASDRSPPCLAVCCTGCVPAAGGERPERVLELLLLMENVLHQGLRVDA